MTIIPKCNIAPNCNKIHIKIKSKSEKCRGLTWSVDKSRWHCIARDSWPCSLQCNDLQRQHVSSANDNA